MQATACTRRDEKWHVDRYFRINAGKEASCEQVVILSLSCLS